MKHYVAAYDLKRIGWCVFIANPPYLRFHAGAFSEKACAESEAARLNDIEFENPIPWNEET